MYVVGFNGPPQCGKDTLATMLADHMDQQGVTMPVFIWPLSLPLRKIAFSMVGLDYSAATPESYEEFKRTEFDVFDRSLITGLSRDQSSTGRELMIDVSERFLKPLYGPDIMTRIFLTDMPDVPAVVLIPDCGFQVEVDSLNDAVGSENFYCALIFREGCDFSNDSRTYIRPKGWQHHVHNDGSLDDLRTEAGRIYGRLVNQCGWKLK